MEKTELRQSGIATLKKLAEQPKKKAKKEEMILALFLLHGSGKKRTSLV